MEAAGDIRPMRVGNASPPIQQVGISASPMASTVSCALNDLNFATIEPKDHSRARDFDVFKNANRALDNSTKGTLELEQQELIFYRGNIVARYNLLAWLCEVTYAQDEFWAEDKGCF
jgi:hypothetical protein